jgi:hypothetical protein
MRAIIPFWSFPITVMNTRSLGIWSSYYLFHFFSSLFVGEGVKYYHGWLKKFHPYELNADDADYADTHGFEVSISDISFRGRKVMLPAPEGWRYTSSCAPSLGSPLARRMKGFHWG